MYNPSLKMMEVQQMDYKMPSSLEKSTEGVESSNLAAKAPRAGRYAVYALTALAFLAQACGSGSNWAHFNSPQATAKRNATAKQCATSTYGRHDPLPSNHPCYNARREEAARREQQRKQQK